MRPDLYDPRLVSARKEIVAMIVENGIRVGRPISDKGQAEIIRELIKNDLAIIKRFPK